MLPLLALLLCAYVLYLIYNYWLPMLLIGIPCVAGLFYLVNYIDRQQKEKIANMSPEEREEYEFSQKLAAWGLKTDAEKRSYAKALNVIREHRKELAIRKRQLVAKRAYGVVDSKQWQDEIELFIEEVIKPATMSSKGAPKEEHWLTSNELAMDDLRKRINKAASFPPPRTKFSETMPPLEYEKLVCDTLRRLGWDAKTTKGSGDQGVDVLASREGVSVVIQCKLYSSPVGNAAVQEAISGREFEKADYAAVVSNATYTKSAIQLASTANVQLLHHDQLSELYDRIKR